jgi:hypothetical protein
MPALAGGAGPLCGSPATVAMMASAAASSSTPVSTNPWRRRAGGVARESRRVDNGQQFQGVMGLAMASQPSVDFCGYWQRNKTA